MHATRLGAFPARGRVTDLRPGNRGLTAYHVVDLEFGVPEFANVEVPATLNGLQNDTEAPEVDPLYSNKSFLAQNRIWDRRHLIDDLLTAGGADDVVVAAGHRTWWRWLEPWFGPGAGVAALVSLLLRLRQRRRASWCAAATGAVLAAGSLMAARPAAVREPVPPRRVLVPAPATMLSHSLCGVDALYVLVQAAGQRDHGYLRVLRLVRPGHMGTDMATLQRVAQTLGVTTRVVDARAYDVPPLPALAHAHGDHFVLVLRAQGDTVEVFDSGIGIVEHSWQALQRTISRPILTIASEAVSS